MTHKDKRRVNRKTLEAKETHLEFLHSRIPGLPAVTAKLQETDWLKVTGWSKVDFLRGCASMQMWEREIFLKSSMNKFHNSLLWWGCFPHFSTENIFVENGFGFKHLLGCFPWQQFSSQELFLAKLRTM